MEAFSQPLATLLRPDNLAEFIGQKHLVGPDKPLRVAIELQAIFSMIFWGPPGSGKTTLARIIAKQTNRDFIELSAVSAGKADIKKVVEESRQQKSLLDNYLSPILFIDEIHRFNKAQQDFLLPYVEDGSIVLIGATTENPSFEIISALLSRSRVFVLQMLSEEELQLVLARAIKLLNQMQKGKKIKLEKKAEEFLLNFANGDARKLLMIVDNAWSLYGNLKLESLKNSLQSKFINYDKKGEEHYNTISAFIKSMRASDLDAALYYLARMVDAGEDPLFIARRMVVFASEDIGMAVPTALVVANAVFRACETIGYPECQENLAHGVAYLASCKKDRRAYDAYMAALADVKIHGNLPVPLKLRNPETKLMKEVGYGAGYQKYKTEYAAGEGNYLPEKLAKKKYFLEK